VVAPFIEPSLLSDLFGSRPPALVVTSWRPDHLVSGVSKLQVYDVCRELGAKLVTNDNVHAKVITGNFKSSIVGSANLTFRGLGIASVPNLEAVVHVRHPSSQLKALISKLLIEGRAVDDLVHERYREWLAAQTLMTIPPLTAPTAAASDPYLVSQLPATLSPDDLWEEVHTGGLLSDSAVHDLQLLHLGEKLSPELFKEAARDSLRANPFWTKLLSEIRESDGGFYFGRLKEAVQRMCADVPMPHRRDLSALVQNLYRWIPSLYPNEFEVVRPNYSELIRPVKGAQAT
jgi:hypothetical protein